MIKALVSGGQTGVDQIGLDVAQALDIPQGGWCPRGRRSEDGSIPERYLLREMSTDDYLSRTEQNVIDSDATLILYPEKLSGGTKKTLTFAAKHKKPRLALQIQSAADEDLVQTIRDWLQGKSVESAAGPPVPDTVVLNIAGPRGSKLKDHAERIRKILLHALKES